MTKNKILNIIAITMLIIVFSYITWLIVSKTMERTDQNNIKNLIRFVVNCELSVECCFIYSIGMIFL